MTVASRYLIQFTTVSLCLLWLSSPAIACSSDDDCGGAGDCKAGKCTCDTPWGGDNCTDFVFKRPNQMEETYAFKRENSSSWGGSVVFSPHDGFYHMFAADMGLHCGLNAWQHNSRIVHVVSQNPEGPYAPAENQSGIEQVMQAFSHNPTIHFYPEDDTYYILHIGDGDGKTPAIKNCSNGTTPVPAMAMPMSMSMPMPMPMSMPTAVETDARGRGEGRQEGGGTGTAPPTVVQPDILYSKSLYGPWKAAPRSGSGCNNPGATVLPNGTVLLVCKMNHGGPSTVDWRQMVMYSAPNFTAPFQLLGLLTDMGSYHVWMLRWLYA